MSESVRLDIIEVIRRIEGVSISLLYDIIALDFTIIKTIQIVFGKGALEMGNELYWARDSSGK